MNNLYKNITNPKHYFRLIVLFFCPIALSAICCQEKVKPNQNGLDPEAYYRRDNFHLDCGIGDCDGEAEDFRDCLLHDSLRFSLNLVNPIVFDFKWLTDSIGDRLLVDEENDHFDLLEKQSRYGHKRLFLKIKGGDSVDLDSLYNRCQGDEDTINRRVNGFDIIPEGFAFNYGGRHYAAIYLTEFGPIAVRQFRSQGFLITDNKVYVMPNLQPELSPFCFSDYNEDGRIEYISLTQDSTTAALIYELDPNFGFLQRKDYYLSLRCETILDYFIEPEQSKWPININEHRKKLIYYLGLPPIER